MKDYERLCPTSEAFVHAADDAAFGEAVKPCLESSKQFLSAPRLIEATRLLYALTPAIFVDFIDK
jgi:hypothetical protein